MTRSPFPCCSVQAAQQAAQPSSALQAAETSDVRREQMVVCSQGKLEVQTEKKLGSGFVGYLMPGAVLDVLERFFWEVEKTDVQRCTIRARTIYG